MAFISVLALTKCIKVSHLTKLSDSGKLLLIYTTSNKSLVQQARSHFENALRETGAPVYVNLGADDHWFEEVIAKDALLDDARLRLAW